MLSLNELNPKQQEAVEAAEGPVMVVAGPGSGKTRVLTYRIAYLISIGVPAYQILALTFTNRAASEMKERISKLVGDKSRQLWMGTFHSIFARILRVEAERLGYTRNYSIYDSSDSLSLIKNIMAAFGIPTQQFNPQAVRSRISGAKNQMIDPQEYAKKATDLFEEKTAMIFAEYQKRLKSNNAMDFDDLLLKPIELFHSSKQLLRKYQDQFRFILVDEYQDTNHAQYVLIQMLASAYRNICVVGDDAQSIYAFRGADIRNILDFQRDHPNARTIRLEQNYRSSGAILLAADVMIKHNSDQITKTLWTENQTGPPITVLVCDDDRDEGAKVIARIYEEVRRLQIDLKDVAIMYRTNAQSRSIEDAFLRNSVPYVIVGGVAFYERKEVKDVLAYLRILANPKDSESFLRIVNYPARGLGDVAVKRLKESAESWGEGLLEACRRSGELTGLSPKAKGSITALSAMFDKFQKLKVEMSLSEWSRALVDELGILYLLKEEGTAEAMGRWENVQELLSAITEFSENRADATLEDFLQDVSLVSNLDMVEDKHNAVTLMTLHSAKGLEYPLVFITGMEEGLLPFYASSPDKKEVEEERRLCYVGITRAMRKLYLTHAKMRYRFGEVTYQAPSRFLDEIGTENIETIAGHRTNTRRENAGSTHSPRPAKRTNEAQHRFYPDETPDYESDDGGAVRFAAGSLVEHELFGRGKIVQLSGKGEAMKVVVDFPGTGRKNLLVKYAGLKVV